MGSNSQDFAGVLLIIFKDKFISERTALVASETAN